MKLSYGTLLIHEEYGFQVVHKMVLWLNLEAKVAQLFFRVLMLRNLVLQDIKYCKVPMYLAAQQQNKLTQFPVCANVGVLFS